jgi:hypothetical protein
MFALRVFAVATLVAATAPPPTLAASALTTIYSFKGGRDGSGPLTGVAAPGGLFYGTTEGATATTARTPSYQADAAACSG